MAKKSSLGRRILRFITQPSSFIYSVTQRAEALRDRMRGLDFSMLRRWDKEGHSNYSRPTFQTRRVIADYLKRSITSKDAIIDIGCGKGMMLWFFSGFPFRLADGLEYSQDLIDVARANFDVLRKTTNLGGGGLEKVHVFQGDAALFDSYDDYNYFYLYNPFYANIMSPFIRHLKDNVTKSPRTIRVLYLHPVLHEMFINEGFSVEEDLHWFSYPRQMTVYRYEA